MEAGWEAGVPQATNSKQMSGMVPERFWIMDDSVAPGTLVRGKPGFPLLIANASVLMARRYSRS